MKAILEFDLPADNENFYGAGKALVFWLCLSEFEEYLEENVSTNEYNYIDKIHNAFLDILEDHNVTLNEYSK